MAGIKHIVNGGVTVCLVAMLLAANAAAPAQPQLPPAQQPPPAQHQPSTVVEDPKACAPSERVPPGRAPGAPSTTGENLSDRLARTDGVICPPNVDPKINAPTPETGKMPVIPPPGSPGGNPNIQPK